MLRKAAALPITFRDRSSSGGGGGFDRVGGGVTGVTGHVGGSGGVTGGTGGGAGRTFIGGAGGGVGGNCGGARLATPYLATRPGAPGFKGEGHEPRAKVQGRASEGTQLDQGVANWVVGRRP